VDQVKFKNDKHFEERIVQALIVDHQFAEQMVEVLDLNYFNFDFLRETTNLLFKYYRNYNAFPSFKLLVHIVETDVKSKLIEEQVKQYLIKISSEPLNGDLEYVKDQSLDFCRRRSLALALEDSLDLIEKKRYEQIVPVIQKALMAGAEKDIGHRLIEDFEKRMKIELRKPIPTPWREINDITQGGPSGGDLCVLCAGTGVGKTHGLVDIGHHVVNLGYTVVHYTLELGDDKIAHRYDSRSSGVAPEQLVYHKDQVLESLQKLPGKLVIKSYPTKSATTLTIKNHIHKLKMMDIEPDLIIVDYGDLMKSQSKYELKRLEEESIYEDLSGLCKELDIPIWTATQTNRDGWDQEVVTLKHIAECFGKAMISDFFLTMATCKESTYNNKEGNFFVAKSRLGPDGIKYPIRINTSLSRIKILSPEEAEEQREEESLHDKMKRCYSKWQKSGGTGEE
jgi:replicative DNA helicase